MSLPDTPNTLREKYYSVMAGQNDADILPDIETAPSTENRYLDYIARNGGGGGGGGAVDTVNGMTGNVVLTAIDVGALPDDTSIPSKTSDLTNDSDFATASDVEKANITDKADGSALSIADSADARVQDLRIYGRTESDHSVGENGLTVTATGKNLLNITATTTTKDGVTFTVDSTNGTVTINGQNETASGLYFILAYRPPFPTGQLILSGCPSGGGTETYCLVYTNNVNVWRYDNGEGVNIEAIDYGEYYNSYIAVRIGAGYSANNVVMRPMVRKATTSADFETYKSITLSLTTALPLRSNGDVRDEIDFADGQAITRIDSNGDVLATPVITPLSATEITAFIALRTFDSVTNITATDDPDMSVTYIKNTANGEAVGAIEDDLQGQINTLNTAKVDAETGKGLSTEDYTTAEKTKLSGIAAGATANTVISTTVTLAANAWVGNAAPYTQTVNVTRILATDEPVLDVSVSDTVATGLDEIEQFGYISKAATGAGTITFSCYEDKPDIALTVKIKVVR